MNRAVIEALFEHVERGLRAIAPSEVVSDAERALAEAEALGDEGLRFEAARRAGWARRLMGDNGATNLLVDVKGRRFPTGGPRGHCWESWTDAEEIDSLVKWEGVFGNGFRSVLVFAYEITDRRHLEKHALWWEFRQRRYAFYGVYASDYAARMKRRSPRWETVCLPARDFRELRHPLLDLL